MAELTPAANRAARGIAGWSIRELADQAEVAFSTVHRFEKTGVATGTTKDKLKAAFETVGIEITNGDGTGARLRSGFEDPKAE